MCRSMILAAGMSAALTVLPGTTAHVSMNSQAATRLGANRGALSTGTFAIRNVTIITMASAGAVQSGTILVRDGRIVAAGSGGAVPAGTGIIDGSGECVLPGLADMHTHLFSDGDEVHDSAGPAEIGVMLANGITAARLMIGTPEQLVLRTAVAEGKVAGPQLWVGSPQLTGRASENAIVVTTPDEARAAVRMAARAGYDFIKLTMFITKPVYDATIEEARRVGIQVAGHVEPVVGLGPALVAKQQIEHLDSFIEEALSDAAPSRVSMTQAGVFGNNTWITLDFVDNRKLDSLAGAMARAGVFVGPTQNVFNTAFGTGETRAQIEERPDFRYWPPRQRQGYLN